MGDGVNIAARLEGVAKPGTICLSEQAYWQVKGRLDLKVSDLGAVQLKNIAEPIHVYSVEVGGPAHAKPAPQGKPTVHPDKPRGLALRWRASLAGLVVVVVVAGAYAWHAGFAPRMMGAPVADGKLANAPRLSIVVLPFENLSGDKEKDYFADSITDELTTDLSHLPDSFVISRGTAFTYKGKSVDAKETGRELGVRYALEGSVRGLGDKVEINAQLISTETGAHVWADRFEAERGKLGESTSRLANSLGLELVKAEASRAEFERPDNSNGVDLAMRGWASMGGGYNHANLDAAIGYFERALRLDPQLTWAKIGLADGLVNRLGTFRAGNLAVDLPRADALLTSALSAKPNSAWAHLVRAELQFQRGRIDEAFSELDVAIENDQNLAAAHGLRGVLRIFVGQAKESIPEIETALRLSPRDPWHNVWEAEICHAYALLGQWEKAVEWCTKSIATDATFYFPYVNLVAAYGWLNRDYEAKNAVASLLKLMPSFTVNYAEKLWFSSDPTFELEEHRILEGLRRAGLPEE
jgi:TolB-like protein/tetratricopeptide (TPR) repeat protein